MEQSLKYNQVHVQTPPMWAKIESYLESALKVSSHGFYLVADWNLSDIFLLILQKSGEAFKEAIMIKIEGKDENMLRLYCEKILMDL